MVMKARPLSDSKIKERPNLGMISIINFLATIWAVSTEVGKASYPVQDSVDKDYKVFIISMLPLLDFSKVQFPKLDLSQYLDFSAFGAIFA